MMMADIALIIIRLCSVILNWNLCFADYYTDQWAVYIKGDEDVARDIAQKHDFVYIAKVNYFSY